MSVCVKITDAHVKRLIVNEKEKSIGGIEFGTAGETFFLNAEEVRVC